MKFNKITSILEKKDKFSFNCLMLGFELPILNNKGKNKEFRTKDTMIRYPR